MTLVEAIKEAIKHEEELAEEKEAQAWEAQLQEEYEKIKSCRKCAEEHRQLAEWLKDYKRLLEQEPCEDWYDVPSDEMTLEQARQAVKDLRKKLAEYLEQEPCEDCISRQSVLAVVGDSCLDLDSYEDTKEFCDEIKELPSVTPQPKTGHWIYDDEYSDCFDVTYKCSCCKREIIVPYEARNEVYKEYPYCHCGAKMQEVEE